MAIYDTLDEFINDVQQLSESSPDYIAKELDIDIRYTDELPNDFLGLADPIQQVIFINDQIDDNFKLFIIAHELTHVVLGEIAAAYLKSSYVTNLKVEKEANEGAISLLLRYYSNVTGFKISEINTNNFMATFEIPAKYHFYVEEIIENLGPYKKPPTD